MHHNLVEILTELAPNLKNNFFSQSKNLTQIKIEAMGANTARSFRLQSPKKDGCYMNYTPTSLFRHWLHNIYLTDKGIEVLKHEMDFPAIHQSAIQSLEKFWLEHEPDVKGIKFYHFAKLIDLFFKLFVRWENLDASRCEWLFNNVNAPLDKYSLLALKEHITTTELKNLNITSNPSMGNVTDERSYHEIQGAIRKLIHPHPPLLFDLYAWDYLRVRDKNENQIFELKRIDEK